MNYPLQDWYQIPHELRRSDWSEPYFDTGGGNALMATLSVPFFAGPAKRAALWASLLPTSRSTG